ncbi:MAG: nitroreductase family protein [Lachnospiraceae bacterium]|nr:nitroreductase family protein [Lachnospiraceae bacterium]
MGTFKELVIKNRSYRGYDESYKFTKEQLEDYVDTTRYAASSVNMQPLKYFVAYEKGMVDTIQKMTKWARALPNLDLPYAGKRPTGFIIICQDTNISPNTERFMKDVGIVAQTILLQATEEGLGGCMIGNFKPEEVKEVLGFKENLVPLLIVALGKPDEEIVITDIKENGSTNYYRDENDVHYVPKRSLKDILIG